MALGFSIALALPLLAADPQEDHRLPVPNANQQSAALAKVKKIFAAEYDKAATADGKQALAKTLFDAAADTTSEAETWTLLAEAARLSAESGAVESCFAAIDAAVGKFAVSPAEARREAIEKIAPKAPPADAARLARMAIEVAQVYQQAKKPETAAELLTTAGSLARKARNNDLAAEAKKLLAQLRAEETAQKATARLLAKLAASPEDPKLCREVGIHLCFERGDWDKGLPLLVKGEDPPLAAAAKADLRVSPRDGKNTVEQVAVADAWAAWAATQRVPAVKSGAEQRAYEFYAAAVDSLEGLEKAAVRKRMAALGGGPGGAFARSKTGPASIPGLVLWLDAADPSSVVSPKKKSGEQRVARWKDLSGSGNDAAQSAEARQPMYRGGFIEFDGNTGLALTSPIAMDAMTLLVEYEPAADRPPRSAIVSSITPGGDAGLQVDFEAHALCFRAIKGGVSEFNLGPQPATGPRFLLASISDSGAMVLRHMAGSTDQAADGMHAGRSFTSSAPLHICGTPGKWRGFSAFKGSIYRVLLYSRVLTSPEITLLKSWSMQNTAR